ncbi:hypothetical protein TWF679_002277 [Orbilia oligospora]|uniref:Uncharacterized protein n=1 Tax=Orbilia oligospora TaxID=2813651 RepID=A0A8H8VGD3_ORBOL|nr:hypothetical protein TWF679_002277 [Orbilia oligospora]
MKTVADFENRATCHQKFDIGFIGLSVQLLQFSDELRSFISFALIQCVKDTDDLTGAIILDSKYEGVPELGEIARKSLPGNFEPLDYFFRQ